MTLNVIVSDCDENKNKREENGGKMEVPWTNESIVQIFFEN